MSSGDSTRCLCSGSAAASRSRRSRMDPRSAAKNMDVAVVAVGVFSPASPPASTSSSSSRLSFFAHGSSACGPAPDASAASAARLTPATEPSGADRSHGVILRSNGSGCSGEACVLARGGGNAGTSTAAWPPLRTGRSLAATSSAASSASAASAFKAFARAFSSHAAKVPTTAARM